MAAHGSSSKRRRLSADARAVNATVHLFTGHGQRQNRWMQGMPTATTGASGVSGVRALQDMDTVPPHSAPALAHALSGFSSFGEEGVPSDTTTTMATNSGSRERGAMLMGWPPGRKSVDAPERTSLPSPAPSDDNLPSPITFGPLAVNQRPARPSVPTYLPFAPTDNPRVPTSRLPSSADRHAPSHPASSSRGSPMLRQHQPFPSPTPRHSSIPPTMAVQPPLSPQPSIGSFYKPELLLHRIQTKLLSYEQQDPAGTQFRAETGRLVLLRNAVLVNDWFYVVLSQLSCLRSLSPASLPQVMNVIGADSYHRLDVLICANTMLQPELVAFFANVPQPIMQIYSGPQRQAYENQLRGVINFLLNLPRHWESIMMESKRRQAPPLVQDLLERLALSSPTLQSTAFRAIARTFWSPDCEPGIDLLMEAHGLDQKTHITLWRRTPAAKNHAYAAYKRVFDEWKLHEQRAKHFMAAQATRGFPFGHERPPPFRIPSDVLAVFGFPVLQSPNGAMAMPPYPLQSARVSEPVQPQAHVQHAQAMTQSQHPRSTSSPILMNHPSTTTRPQWQDPSRMYQLEPGTRLSHRGQTPVFPTLDKCPRAQPTHPDHRRAALHQAHLHSPVMGRIEAQPNAPKLYRQVTGWVLSPTLIDTDKPMQTMAFLSEDLTRLPQLHRPPESPGTTVRVLVEHSTTYRLRCVRIDGRQAPPDLESWVQSDCYWPDTLYFDVNGAALETRRKLQHGRYLAIDLTSHLKAGVNELTVTVNRISTDRDPLRYAIAVEKVETLRHESIVQDIQTIPLADSLATIKRSLSASNNNADDDDDDDDLVMTSSATTIHLFDPISASQIFDTPVRGQQCLHRDPFDLETFLATRRRERPGYPSEPDDWRCPICKGDVRPAVLVKDGFLVDVRERLKLRGMLDTRAIVVHADGSWKVSGGEVGGVEGARLCLEESAALLGVTGPKKSRPVVIELD